MRHICVSKLTIIGSDYCLSPGQRQAIIWTNARILLIWPLRTNFSEILIEIHTFALKIMHLKISSGKGLGLNVSRWFHVVWTYGLCSHAVWSICPTWMLVLTRIPFCSVLWTSNKILKPHPSTATNNADRQPQIELHCEESMTLLKSIMFLFVMFSFPAVRITITYS